MAYPEIERLSPNRSAAVQERLGVVFHHSQRSFPDTIDLMVSPVSRVSYHLLIDADGTRCTLVPETQVAWHAGISTFLGRPHCNDFMLGVAFAGDSYARPLTDAQLGSALEWLGPRWGPLGWSLDRMTDHRQVAPGRKDDLNPVEWDRLAAALRAQFAPGSFPS
jgi:AmpD protein